MKKDKQRERLSKIETKEQESEKITNKESTPSRDALRSTGHTTPPHQEQVGTQNATSEEKGGAILTTKSQLARELIGTSDRLLPQEE